MKYLLLFLLIPNLCFAGTQTVKVQVQFSEDVDVKGTKITYSDALYFTPEKYAEMKQDEIDTLKQERINNWKAVIETPIIEKEITKEDLEAQIASLEEQKASIKSQKVELNAKLVAIAVVDKPIDEKITEEIIK